MKKITINMLTIFVAMMNFSVMVKSYDQEAQTPKRGSYGKYGKRSRKSKVITFIPNESFGGDLAQGTYVRKEQSATVTHGDKTYSFINIIKSFNPSGPIKNNLPEDLTLIGSFSTYNSGPEMPVTTYLFGSPVKTEDTTVETTHESSEEKPERNLMGSSSSSYAPVVFFPESPFNGDGLVGNYFSNNKIATIHDPSGQNNQSYTFKNVQQGGITAPEGLILIGSYLTKPHCSGHVCSTVMAQINLYGQQVDSQDL